PGERLVVVVDGEHLQGVWGLEPPERGISLADLGVHVILLLGHRREEPEQVDARITVAADGTARTERDGTGFTVDRVGDPVLSGLARLLAPLRMVPDEGSGDVLSSTVGLPEILGVSDVAKLTPTETWRPRPLRERLRVPIGVGSSGHAVML